MSEQRAVKYPAFLANVQLLMKELRWDQTELAHQVGSTQSSVSRWGYSSVPRGPVLAKLAALGGVDTHDIIETPLAEARKSRRATLPSGRKLVETMATMLDSAGLPHLVDEYAPKLARLLPGLLADSEVRLEEPASVKSKPTGGLVQVRAKVDPGKPR